MPNNCLRARLEHAHLAALASGEQERERILEQALVLEAEITDLMRELAGDADDVRSLNVSDSRFFRHTCCNY